MHYFSFFGIGNLMKDLHSVTNVNCWLVDLFINYAFCRVKRCDHELYDDFFNVLFLIGEALVFQCDGGYECQECVHHFVHRVGAFLPRAANPIDVFPGLHMRDAERLEELEDEFLGGLLL